MRATSKSKADKRRAFLEWAEAVGPLPTSILAVGPRSAAEVERARAPKGAATEGESLPAARSRFDRNEAV